ncbi:hypothetical protein GKG47_09260 [Lactonifactor sp. BIOML-A3]|uniref:hypothetical protein n=1 Tax=unclassified Lactonifactor TaxID=2636670 RepID=UPI0012B12FAF|nr:MULTISPECIES: hypothetical protein [unclassified Lactonifactor]MSA02225.1 hypothetical protein [Lactonifactor sp. BIOML-A5]MSA08009.1 hypothetical protein [Lactonifactor sp. BIOML-A4]MSA12625.1 hypothetical protein [Lactonifactor sp. BIOML-A3]MSA16673.1 hypothetical protein [Lactonifactor sp. BIOML-A2]MSA37628.1 hypothetical protein [Lactonifactor sp. BIOML-A1]
MNVKTSKHIHEAKKKIINGWYFCMKPLAFLIEKYEKSKSVKNRARLENMSLEEVARLYVKYTVKAMVKRKNSKEEYYCCTKKNGYPEYYEDNFVLADLTTFGYSRFDKTKLRDWYCYALDYKAIGYGDGSKERWINLENRLRDLVGKEFLRVGCKVEYIDQSDKLDDWFIKQSGYEKTMIISV